MMNITVVNHLELNLEFDPIDNVLREEYINNFTAITEFNNKIFENISYIYPKLSFSKSKEKYTRYLYMKSILTDSNNSEKCSLTFFPLVSVYTEVKNNIKKPTYRFLNFEFVPDTERQRILKMDYIFSTYNIKLKNFTLHTIVKIIRSEYFNINIMFMKN